MILKIILDKSTKIPYICSMTSRKQAPSTCVNCGKVTQKDLSEIMRNAKVRRNSFCSISCSISYRNNNDPRYQSEEYKKQFVEKMKKYQHLTIKQKR